MRLAYALRFATTSLFALQTIAQQQICNNIASFCDRRYSNITHLGAHDSPFVRTPANNYSISGDQFYNSTTQLDAGVRLLTLQLHEVNGDYRLCHTLCQLLDAGSFQDWLTTLRQWLDANRNEVVTILIVNSDDADAATIGAIYEATGVDKYSYSPEDVTVPLKDWPTLSSMISQNARLVTFVATIDPRSTQAAPYLLNEYTFAFENSVNNIQPSDFSCALDRPPSLVGDTAGALADGMLPILNHFRYDDINGIHVPSIDNIETTNAAAAGGGPGNMGEHAVRCASEYGRNPAFILTDFSNVGDTLEVVDRLNGVVGLAQGRLALPDTVRDSMDMPEIVAPPPSSTGDSPASTSASPGGSASAAGVAEGTSEPEPSQAHQENVCRYVVVVIPMLACLISFT